MILLKAAKGEVISNEIEDVTLKFSSDMNANFLEAQLSTFRVLVKDMCFHDILVTVSNLKMHEQKLLEHVITVCKLILHGTSATGERSFSTARRLKTWERPRVQQARFNHLAILNTHRERLDDLWW